MLSPEDKKRIYEEEKARIEAREQIERERRRTPNTTTTGMTANVTGMLSYAGWWVTGIIFLVLEQKNDWVRFHAAQSIVVFGAVTVAQAVLGLIPFVGSTLSALVLAAGFILWIILMVKAFNGERFRLPWAADFAEKVFLSTDIPASDTDAGARPEAAPSAPAAPADLDGQIKGKVDEYLRTFKSRREGRITASAVAIAWSIALYVFFNYFNQYVAYYHSEKIGNTVTLIREPFFTGEISSWLPILSATLAVSILGHIVMIIIDKRVLHEIIRIVINGFGLATIISLIRIFPFNFDVIPNPTAADAVHTALPVVLICIGIGLGISVLVRLIKLISNTARGITDYQ